jgi:hypothetical protein
LKALNYPFHNNILFRLIFNCWMQGERSPILSL